MNFNGKINLILGSFIIVMADLSNGTTNSSDGCSQTCDSKAYYASWSLRKIGNLEFSGSDRDPVLREFIDSAPCPPSWNVSLLCDFHARYSRLDCEESTLLLEKCLDERVTEKLLSILKKCSKTLDCESYMQLCRRKLAVEDSRTVCVPRHRTSPQIIPISDSKTTASSRIGSRTSASSDDINTRKDLGPLPGVTMNYSSSYSPGSVTMDYNTTANGTVLVVRNPFRETATDVNHAQDTDLSVLWFLLLIPYCFILVPCIIHFCIKRRKKKSIYRPAEMEQQTKKPNGTFSGEEPLIAPAHISTVAANPFPDSENRKSIGDAFDDWDFIDADNDGEQQLLEREDKV